MKKIVYILAIMVLMMSFASCKKNITSDEIKTSRVSGDTTAASQNSGSDIDDDDNNSDNNTGGNSDNKSNKNNNQKYNPTRAATVKNSDLSKSKGSKVVGYGDIKISGKHIDDMSDAFSDDSSNDLSVGETEDNKIYTAYRKDCIAQKTVSKNDKHSTITYFVYSKGTKGPLDIKIGDTSSSVLSKLSNSVNNNLSFDTPKNDSLLYLTESNGYTCAATSNKDTITCTVKNNSGKDVTVLYKIKNDRVNTIEISYEA